MDKVELQQLQSVVSEDILTTGYDMTQPTHSTHIHVEPTDPLNALYCLFSMSILLPNKEETWPHAPGI